MSEDGCVVIHHVQVSLVPNWIGGPQRRVASLNGRQLTLATAEPVVTLGKLRHASLLWRRP